LPFDAAPRVVSPASGFVFNANNRPFYATAEADNLKPENFSSAFGIETRMTNRAFRAFEQLNADTSITREAFRAYKFDKSYSKDSMLAGVMKELLAKDFTGDDLLMKAQAVLRNYDMTADAESRGAALAIMTALPVVVPTFQGKPPGDAVASLRKAAQTLMQHFGRLDPQWGEVNRLRRGTLDLPVGGGPDTLRAIESTVEPGSDGRFKANKGDTLIYFVEWDPQGKAHAESIHQFGSATLDAASPHYADQAPLYQRQEMKPVWLDEADVRQHLEREYRPGR
jgi:acyl-homoserine-lactone acylase